MGGLEARPASGDELIHRMSGLALEAAPLLNCHINTNALSDANMPAMLGRMVGTIDLERD